MSLADWTFLSEVVIVLTEFLEILLTFLFKAYFILLYWEQVILINTWSAMPRLMCNNFNNSPFPQFDIGIVGALFFFYFLWTFSLIFFNSMIRVLIKYRSWFILCCLWFLPAPQIWVWSNISNHALCLYSYLVRIVCNIKHSSSLKWSQKTCKNCCACCLHLLIQAHTLISRLQDKIICKPWLWKSDNVISNQNIYCPAYTAIHFLPWWHQDTRQVKKYKIVFNT